MILIQNISREIIKVESFICGALSCVNLLSLLLSVQLTCYIFYIFFQTCYKLGLEEQFFEVVGKLIYV